MPFPSVAREPAILWSFRGPEFPGQHMLPKQANVELLIVIPMILLEMAW